MGKKFLLPPPQGEGLFLGLAIFDDAWCPMFFSEKKANDKYHDPFCLFPFLLEKASSTSSTVDEIREELKIDFPIPVLSSIILFLEFCHRLSCISVSRTSRKNHFVELD